MLSTKKILGLPLILSGILVIGWFDWVTSYELNLYVFYFFPVSLAAWYYGLEAATLFSLISALVWFGAVKLSGHTYSNSLFAVWNTMIRLSSFLLIGWGVRKINTQLVSEREKNEELAKLLSEIKVLEAFLAVCCKCKKIRDENGQWQQMEQYISDHSATRFSHSYCPECAQDFLQEAGLAGEKPADRHAADGR